MDSTPHELHPEHPPEIEASHREGWRSKLWFTFLACVMVVVLSKLVSIGTDGFNHWTSDTDDVLHGAWVDGKGSTMVVPRNRHEQIVLTSGERGFRLTVKDRTDTLYEGRMFCNSHQGDVGAFHLQRTSDNSLAVTLLPSGQPRVELLLSMAK